MVGPRSVAPHAACSVSLRRHLLLCAGLCCAALLAHYGYKVTVCESHYLPGGAAHSFEIKGFKFDAGPSFHAGLSAPFGKSSNPLKQVLDVIGETVACSTYDRCGQAECIVLTAGPEKL